MATNPEPRLTQPMDANLTLLELRAHRRYPIVLSLEWKCSQGRMREQLGSGTTVNVSSGGVLFHSSAALPLQSRIELRLSWPVTLEDCPLKLVMRGHIVRSAGYSTAVRITQHEFRIAGRRSSVAFA